MSSQRSERLNGDDGVCRVAYENLIVQVFVIDARDDGRDGLFWCLSSLKSQLDQYMLTPNSRVD